MSRYLTRFAVTLVAGFATLTVYADADEIKTIKFTVEKMTCATCPIAVRKAMERVNGVKDVQVDLNSKIAIVVFDPGIVSPKTIAEASTDVGFPATVQGDKQ